MGFLSRLFGRTTPIDYSKYHTLEITVAGTSYKQKELKEYFIDLIDYEKYDGLSTSEIKSMYSEGDTIYEMPYKTDLFTDCELIPEPNNEYDKNAIKVVGDDIHIGYIPKDRCKEVFNIMESITNIDMYAYGGKYKEIYCDIDSGKEKIRSGKKDYGIILEILYKEN